MKREIRALLDQAVERRKNGIPIKPASSQIRLPPAPTNTAKLAPRLAQPNRSLVPPPFAPGERCLTPAEIAKLLGVSIDVARRTFAKVPGTIVIGGGRRRMLRVPEGVFAAWLEYSRVGGGTD